MSNIAIQRDNGNQPSLATRGSTPEWDPFRAMRELLQWNPWGEPLASLRGTERLFAPSFEIKETQDAFVFRADVPGVKEADLDVKLTQNRLSISGKRDSERTEKGETFYTTERSYGSFTRAFTLPDGIDAAKIKAELKEGVLTLSVPKKPEVQPKKIDVTTK